MKVRESFRGPCLAFQGLFDLVGLRLARPSEVDDRAVHLGLRPQELARHGDVDRGFLPDKTVCHTKYMFSQKGTMCCLRVHKAGITAPHGYVHRCPLFVNGYHIHVLFKGISIVKAHLKMKRQNDDVDPGFLPAMIYIYTYILYIPGTSGLDGSKGRDFGKALEMFFKGKNWNFWCL